MKYTTLIFVSLYLLLIIGVSSCEEPVDINLDFVSPRLVVSSTFLPGQPVQVRVSATQSVLDTRSAPEINNARVSIYDGQQLTETLIYVSGNEEYSGYYTTSNFVPLEGRRYVLQVSAPGYDPVHAESMIPDPVSILNMEIENLSYDNNGASHIYAFTLIIDYDDPVETKDYYDLVISQLVTPFKVTQGGDTLLYEETSLPVYDGNSLRGQAIPLLHYLVQDKPLNRPVSINIFSKIDESSYLPGNIITELRTVSYDYFKFQRSFSDHQYVTETGIHDPVIIYQNIQNGQGIFAGYNTASKTVSLSE